MAPTPKFELPDGNRQVKKLLIQFHLAGPLEKHFFPAHISREGKESDEQKLARASRPKGEQLLFERGILNAPSLLAEIDRLGFVLRRTRAQGRMSKEREVKNSKGMILEVKPPKPYTVLEFTFYRPREGDEAAQNLKLWRAYLAVMSGEEKWGAVGVFQNEDDDPSLCHMVWHFAGEMPVKEAVPERVLGYAVESYQNINRREAPAEVSEVRDLGDIWNMEMGRE